MSNPIEQHAPEVAAALAAVRAARIALDIDLDDPRVENFADQFGVDVSVIDDDLRRRFLEAGADEATFEAVDAYADSDLPPATKAALALTDAMIWTPYVVPLQVIEDAQAHLAAE